MSIPAKIIVAWYGLIADIPAGWHICDGAGGTPDLRGYFIRGQAAGVESSNTAKGSAYHDHLITETIASGSATAAGSGALRTAAHIHSDICELGGDEPLHKRLVFIMKT